MIKNLEDEWFQGRSMIKTLEDEWVYGIDACSAQFRALQLKQYPILEKLDKEVQKTEKEIEESRDLDKEIQELDQYLFGSSLETVKRFRSSTDLKADDVAQWLRSCDEDLVWMLFHYHRLLDLLVDTVLPDRHLDFKNQVVEALFRFWEPISKSVVDRVHEISERHSEEMKNSRFLSGWTGIWLYAVPELCRLRVSLEAARKRKI